MHSVQSPHQPPALAVMEAHTSSCSLISSSCEMISPSKEPNRPVSPSLAVEAVPSPHTLSLFSAELNAHHTFSRRIVRPSPQALSLGPRDPDRLQVMPRPDDHLALSPCPPTSTPPPLPRSPPPQRYSIYVAPPTYIPLFRDHDTQPVMQQFSETLSPAPPDVTPPPLPLLSPLMGDPLPDFGLLLPSSEPMPSLSPITNPPSTHPHMAFGSNQRTFHNLPEQAVVPSSCLLTRADLPGHFQQSNIVSIDHDSAFHLSPLNISTALSPAPLLSTPPDSSTSCSFSKTERPFTHGKPGSTVWYECKSMGSCAKTSQQHLELLRSCVAAELGYMFRHQRWEDDDGVFWLLIGNGWNAAIEGCHHPVFRGRRLHIRGSGEPSWLTSGSYAVHKSRTMRRMGGGTRSVSVVCFLLIHPSLLGIFTWILSCRQTLICELCQF